MKINAIDRASDTYNWLTSEQLSYDEMYITKSGRICMVTMDTNPHPGHMFIVFLDDFGICHKIPYFNKDERFARLYDVNLTLEYDIDRIDTK